MYLPSLVEQLKWRKRARPFEMSPNLHSKSASTVELGAVFARWARP